MGIIRLILLGVAIWLVWRVVRQTLLPGPDKRDTDGGPTRTEQSTQDAAKMLKCEQCGVHVPESESFSARGHHFCSSAHQQAWLEQHDAGK